MPKTMFDSQIYRRISYDDLVTYCVYSLERSKKQPTFENLVAECFRLFPARFHLPGYPEWPDSSQIEKTWVRCRTDKGYIKGSKAKGFSITAKGLEIANRLEKLFKVTGKTKRTKEFGMKGDARTRSGRFVRQLENSMAFQRFLKKGEKADISEHEFCDLIYCMIDSLPNIKRGNLKELKYHISVYKREDLKDFLKFCERKFEDLLYPESRDSKRYIGGMMKQKAVKKEKGAK